MNDQQRQQYTCQTASRMYDLPKPKSSKSIQEERHSSGPEKLQIQSKQDISKKKIDVHPQIGTQINKSAKRGYSPRYFLQKDKQKEGSDRLKDSGSSGSNRTEHQHNSLSQKVLYGPVKYKYEEQERNICQFSLQNTLEKAKQEFKNAVNLQLHPETAAYLKGNFKLLDKLLIEESKLIKSLLNVKSQRNTCKKSLISEQCLSKKQVNTLNMAYKHLEQCFYRQNEFNYEFEKQSQLQKKQMKIVEYKKQIATLTGQKQQLIKELMKKPRLRLGQEPENGESSSLAIVEEENKKLREAQQLTQEKMAKLQRNESQNIQKIGKLEQEKQILCAQIIRYVQSFQKRP